MTALEKKEIGESRDAPLRIHPFQERKRGGNKHAAWITCTRCGVRLSYVPRVAGSMEEEWQNSHFQILKVNSMQTLAKIKVKPVSALGEQECRMCSSRIKIGHQVANDGISWVHARCLLKH